MRNSASDHAARRRKRDTQLRYRYGITLAQYDALLTYQGGVCAICREPESAVDAQRGTRYSLAVDHNHTTGLLRGLLCQRCNRGIGFLQDSVTTVRAALEYLLNGGISGPT